MLLVGWVARPAHDTGETSVREARIYDATTPLDSATGWFRVGVELPDGSYGDCAYDENRPQDREYAIQTAYERARAKSFSR